MKIKPLTLMNIALAAVLVTSLFMVGATPSSSVDEYDHWCDLNDDGVINIFDVVKMASRYGATGTPINKTELLLDLQNRVERLESGYVGSPAYDSGWTSIPSPSNWLTVNHNLNTTNVFIYILGRNYMGQMHQSYLGGERWTGIYPDSQHLGIHWMSDYTHPENILRIQRHGDDSDYSPEGWTEIRIMIWKIPQP